MSVCVRAGACVRVEGDGAGAGESVYPLHILILRLFSLTYAVRQLPFMGL